MSARVDCEKKTNCPFVASLYYAQESTFNNLIMINEYLYFVT